MHNLLRETMRAREISEDQMTTRSAFKQEINNVFPLFPFKKVHFSCGHIGMCNVKKE
jgi:hypothetical protein